MHLSTNLIKHIIIFLFFFLHSSITSLKFLLQESIVSISFSNKSSRYLCSGGSGRIVRIWDLQRKRCIKWLRGHTDTITGVIYNCKDEHLASISMKGDLILHNLASGARTAELKDPNGQVVWLADGFFVFLLFTSLYG